MMEFRLSASMISCLICLRQINIDFQNTNFRLMGDYEKFVEAFDAFIKSKDKYVFIFIFIYERQSVGGECVKTHTMRAESPMSLDF